MKIKLIIFFCFCSILFSKQTINFPLDLEGIEYDLSIPNPEEVLGHKIGTRHTRPSQVVDYFETVASISERVVLKYHGKTHEGRQLIHAFVTHPDNIKNLEKIRQNNLLLSDKPEYVKNSDLDKMPLIAYLGFSIHGDEASGTEAAILLLHYLASGKGGKIDQILKNCVFIIDPMFNPDGRARFVNWVNGNRGIVATTDLQDREHNQPWPQGRTNHYLFDLNRDWMPVTQPETDGRIKVFHHWRPQFLLDVHEMGKNATYFFQPGIPIRNNPNTPKKVFELTEKLSKYNARNLDEIGSLYFTGENFDDFYYGKGSTFGDIHGSVGVLFEQASSRALKSETEMGVLEYPFAIRNQFLSTLGTVEGLNDMRKEFLSYQQSFYATSTKEAQKNSTKGYLIMLMDNPVRAQLLINNLQKHRVEFYSLKNNISVDGKKVNPGEGILLPLDQPQTRFIKAVMEKVTSFKDSLFYDVSAWTLPLAYGVKTYEIKKSLSQYQGEKLNKITVGGGKIIGGKAKTAYLMKWGSYYTPRALYRVLDAGIYPRLVTEPLKSEINQNTYSFDYGTIIIPVVQRDASSKLTEEAIHELANKLAHEDHVTLYALNSSLTPEGPDLGGRYQKVLKKPKIALLSGKGTTPYDVGETWHLLNQRMEIPVSLLDVNTISNKTVAQYNTIIMVRGSYKTIDSSHVKVFQSWVEGGGTLITIANASKWAIENMLIDETLIEVPKDSLDIPYKSVSSTKGAQKIGGSIFSVALDKTHPVAYGYKENASVFRFDNTFYNLSSEPGANVARYTDSPLLSGYISKQNLNLIKGTASIIARKKEKGHIVMFADNPNFRAFWYGTNGLFLNAVFFGHTF